MNASLPLRLLATLAVGMLAGCQQPSVDRGRATSSQHASASAGEPVIAPVPAATADAKLPGDHARTRRYEIAITLPTLPAADAPLTNALRAAADHTKREFLAALPDPAELPEFANRRLQLFLTYKVAATTPAFTSVRESGSEDTGGAHPIPIEATFVLDRKAGRLITLDDLFADPDAARTAIAKVTHAALLGRFMAKAPTPREGSAEAIREWKGNLLQMLDGGTRPTSVNYSLFVVRAGARPDAPSPGLTLVFAPYQVAPYVYGTQTVDIPTETFAQFLKPRYAAAFAN
jgi:hypothetical protein